MDNEKQKQEVIDFLENTYTGGNAESLQSTLSI